MSIKFYFKEESSNILIIEFILVDFVLFFSFYVNFNIVFEFFVS